MRTYSLESEFLDPRTEQRLLAAIAGDLNLYWQLQDLLPEGSFQSESAAWNALRESVSAGTVPAVLPVEPSVDARGDALRLADLYQRRLLAGLQERLAEALFDESRPAAAVAALLEVEAAAVRGRVRGTAAGTALSGCSLLDDTLALARQRLERRKTTGKPCSGIPTGLARLDQILNGFNEGLHVLAAGPGMGKTTLCTQWALHAAASQVPVVYVTYENSPQSLVLKMVCSRAGLSPSQVERGFADLTLLNEAAAGLREPLRLVSLIEGTSQMAISQVRGRALQVRESAGSEQVLVVFDYLQRAAHGKGYEQLRHNVSAMAAELREMASRLQSPVIAISSQNRSVGDYGRGGSAQLDSLKESGDLEYAADSVLFLTQARDRTATDPARAVDLVVVKNRFGGTGMVPLIFRPDTGVFREEAPLVHAR